MYRHFLVFFFSFVVDLLLTKKHITELNCFVNAKFNLRLLYPLSSYFSINFLCLYATTAHWLTKSIVHVNTALLEQVDA